MKRAVVGVLTLILICSTLSGCGKAQLNGHEGKTYNVTVQGAVFGGTDGDQIDLDVSFDPGWVTGDSNTEYNKDLASFAAVLCDEVYFRAKDLKSGTQNRVLFEGENVDEYDVTAFLKEVGFSEAEYVESFKAKEYEFDGNDSVTMLLSHGVVDEKYDLYAVAIRGCYSLPERLSIYDPGSENAVYTELTGQHPEWTDKETGKGLDIAKGRALEFIDEFIEANDDPALENCILVTGHSRGGALACLIGAQMEDRENMKSYTYTFNSPRVTTNEKAQEYKTIYNVFDSNDYYVDYLPFGEEKFYRYGRDMTIAIEDSAEIVDAIAKIKGRDDFATLSKETKEKYAEVFGERFKNRDSLYNINTITKTFDTEEEAMAKAEEYRGLIGSESGLSLERLCSVSDAVANDQGKYEVSLNYYDEAILQIIAEMTAYGGPVYDAAVRLLDEDEQACEILGIIMENSEGVAGGHRLINSFVLSQYVKLI